MKQKTKKKKRVDIVGKALDDSIRLLEAELRRRRKRVAAGLPEVSKYYRIDVEFPSEHGFSYQVLFALTKEENMKKQVAKLKEAGMGGRLVFLDGTPDGQVVEQWGSVERVAEAERLEKGLDK